MTAGRPTDVLFEPLRIGPLTARSRVIVPPHSSAVGNLWGTEQEAEQAVAYLRRRAEAGVAWTTMPGRVSNVLAPGFEPSGISAVVQGPFRHENYVERTGRFVSAMHAVGALAATQLTMNGGYPHAPSARFAQPVNALAPHAITTDEIRLLLDEYRFSAARAADAGVDILELHMNHEDLSQQFLSRAINVRTDEYGGSLENRTRFAVNALAAAREQIGPDRVVGVRMNAADPRFYTVDEGIEIAQHLATTGLVDYFHIVFGSTWGNPSYIQPHFFRPGQWAPLAASYKSELPVPVIYTGLVDSATRAAEIVSAGDADMVGMARAHIADPDVLANAKRGATAQTRPCVGVNDCINRRYVDGLPFGCAVNPHAAVEVDGDWAANRITRRLAVVGAGPAGLELAALAAEAGAAVTLFDRAHEIGGQLLMASSAPSFGRYRDYVTWQRRRLARLSVGVQLGMEMRAESPELAASDLTVVVATGARDRIPSIPGVEGSNVFTARDVMHGRVAGDDIAVVVQDDHLAPFAIAEKLAIAGARVTMFYATHVPGQLLGRYSIGSVLGRMDDLGVRIRIMEEVVSISDGAVHVRNVYSGRADTVNAFDAVVLACGGESESHVFEGLRSAGRDEVYIIGDAYAPRRLVFATRQALAVAKLLADADARKERAS